MALVEGITEVTGLAVARMARAVTSPLSQVAGILAVEESFLSDYRASKRNQGPLLG